MKPDDICEDLLYWFKLLREQNLNSSKGGNASIRGWITPTGCLAETVESLVPIRHTKASRDAPIHCQAYHNEKIRAVLHAHSPYTMAAFNSNCLPSDLELTVTFLGGVPVVSGDWRDKKVKQNLGLNLAAGGIVVHTNHGVYAAGMDAKEAYAKITSLEHSCKIGVLTWGLQRGLTT